MYNETQKISAFFRDKHINNILKFYDREGVKTSTSCLLFDIFNFFAQHHPNLIEEFSENLSEYNKEENEKD